MNSFPGIASLQGRSRPCAALLLCAILVIVNVTRTAEWRNEIENAGSVSHFMNGRELANYFETQYGEFKIILGDLGLAR